MKIINLLIPNSAILPLGQHSNAFRFGGPFCKEDLSVYFLELVKILLNFFLKFDHNRFRTAFQIVPFLSKTGCKPVQNRPVLKPYLIEGYFGCNFGYFLLKASSNTKQSKV